MRLAPLLLVISIAGHLVFAGWWWLNKAQSEVPPLAAPADHVTTPKPTGTSGESERRHTADTWSRWTANSDAEFAAQLKREGFPASVVRMLVERRIRERYQAPLTALETNNRLPFWRTPRTGYSPASLSPEARLERRKILNEINDAVRVAVGPTTFEELSPYEKYQHGQSMGILPKAKADQISVILTDYEEMGLQLYEEVGRAVLKSDRERFLLLRESQRADIEALLTPAELLEYDLRSGDSAGTVRYKLRSFDPSEAEYRTLTQLQIQFDRDYPYMPGPEAAQRRKAAEAQLNERMAATLSPERAAEFSIVTDPNFRPQVQFLENFGYQAALAREFVVLQQDIARRAESVQKNQLYTVAQRQAELEALHREASAKLGAKLTPQALKAYQTGGVGRWLQTLTSPAPSPQGP